MDNAMNAGKRVLVVEDEFLVAEMIVDIVERTGAAVVGPAANIREALDLIGAGEVDAAVLDWNLAGEPGERVAEALAEADVPFVISTGYGAVTGAFADRPLLSKPYPGAMLVDLLRDLLAD